MFCKQCGAKLDDDAQFCEHCGTVVKHVAFEGKAPEILETMGGQEQDNVTITEEERPIIIHTKKKLKIGFIIGIAALLVMAAAGIMLNGILGEETNVEKSNIYLESNFNNGGKLAYDDSHLYVVGLYDEDDENTSVYSTDYNGINKTLISDNENIDTIRICDERIYYKALEDDEYTIGVMETDGSSDTVIVTSSHILGHYDIYDNILYYIVSSEIHSCALDGEYDSIIVEGADTFTLCNGTIYFVDSDDVISSYKIKNGNTKELCKASGAHDLSVDGNTLYFACDTGLSITEIDGDGTVTKVIRDSDLSSYVFYDNFIYYKHNLSNDDIETIAEYIGGDDSIKVLLCKINLLDTGLVYRADITGGYGEAVESDQFSVRYLYSYPQGLYCVSSVISDNLYPVEIV